jgi:type II secretory pathway component PulF
MILVLSHFEKLHGCYVYIIIIIIIIVVIIVNDDAELKVQLHDHLINLLSVSKFVCKFCGVG